MICAIDFGTSNSTVGLAAGGAARLIALEGDHVTLPSAVFYDFEDHITRFGRDATRAYTAHHEGRLLRALKSVLGTALIDETTQLGNRNLSFKTIIGTFVAHLKTRAETEAGRELTQVVMGRPVNFIDGDEVADARAQDQLEEIVRGQGFKEILFQYEPVAAALSYENTITEEQLVLVADIGGGTSDFSLVRVGPSRRGSADRWDDILANTGVHVGGTDLDLRLSLGQVMPLLGHGSRMRLSNGGEVAVPSLYYYDLATWHRIVFLYTRKFMAELSDMERTSLAPALIRRFANVVRERQGHLLAGHVEAAKVRLSDAQSAEIDLQFIEQELRAVVGREEFECNIERELEAIEKTVAECMAQAGVTSGHVSAVFLTGGSTAVPAVFQACTRLLPTSRIIEGDKFASVGLGLTLDAQKRF